MIRIKFKEGGDSFNILAVDEIRYDKEKKAFCVFGLEYSGNIPYRNAFGTDADINDIFLQILRNGFIDMSGSDFGEWEDLEEDEDDSNIVPLS